MRPRAMAPFSGGRSAVVGQAFLEKLNRLGGSRDEPLAFEERSHRRWLRAACPASRSKQRAQRAVVADGERILEPRTTLARDPDRAKDADQTTRLSRADAKLVADVLEHAKADVATARQVRSGPRVGP